MIFLFFGLVRLMLAQLLSSPSFLFFGPASPPTDVVMPPRHVMLSSHLAASALSSSNTLFCRFLTQVNWSIESTRLLQATVLRPPNSHPLLL
jgi:uncharacterized membrane protein YfcA